LNGLDRIREAARKDKNLRFTSLNQIYEVDFLGFSYGFRPNRQPHQALDAVWVGTTQRKVNWVLDADIRGFLDKGKITPWLLGYQAKDHREAFAKVYEGHVAVV